MAELVYAHDSKSCEVTLMRVRFPPLALASPRKLLFAINDADWISIFFNKSLISIKTNVEVNYYFFSQKKLHWGGDACAPSTPVLPYLLPRSSPSPGSKSFLADIRRAGGHCPPSQAEPAGLPEPLRTEC